MLLWILSARWLLVEEYVFVILFNRWVTIFVVTLPVVFKLLMLLVVDTLFRSDRIFIMAIVHFFSIDISLADGTILVDMVFFILSSCMLLFSNSTVSSFT